MIDHLVDGFVIKVDRNGGPRVWKSPVEPQFNPDMPFSEVYERWAKQGNITEKTKREFKVAVADFVSFADDPPIGRVEKYLVDEYCDLAASLPASLPRAVRALSFRQRIAWAEHQQPTAERISPATLKKRATAISAIASFAHRKNIIKIRPARNAVTEGYDRNGSPRRLFSAEEIQVGDIQMRDGAWCFIFTEEEHNTGKRDEDKPKLGVSFGGIATLERKQCCRALTSNCQGRNGESQRSTRQLA